MEKILKWDKKNIGNKILSNLTMVNANVKYYWIENKLMISELVNVFGEEYKIDMPVILRYRGNMIEVIDD